MANRKISDLTALTAPATGDLLPIVDISEATAADKNKKITLGTLLSGAPLGSAAAPSFAFSGDSNTGIYSPGADQVAISTGGTGRVFVSSAGLVGIGTTSTGDKLDVSGVIRATNTTDGNFYGTFSNPDGLTRIRAYGGGSSICFDLGTSEHARIDSSGRLLVGTSSARSIATQSLAIQNEGTSFGTTGFSTCRNSNDIYGAYIHFGKTRGASIGSNAIVASGDDLGGLIFGGADGTDVDSQAAYILCQVDGTPGANDMPGRLVFSTTADGATSPTERMRIASSGQSLWGTTSTTGNAFASTAAFGLAIDPAKGQILNCADGQPAGYFNRTGSDGGLFVFNRNGTEKGNIAVTTIATTYNSVSDYRLKENVIPFSNGITRLLQLKPSRFNFIVDPDHTVDGFIAHEAQAVVPECVTGEKDAVDADGNPVYQGIDQSKLVPLLTAALQEAIARIETLETRLSALEGA